MGITWPTPAVGSAVWLRDEAFRFAQKAVASLEQPLSSALIEAETCSRVALVYAMLAEQESSRFSR